MQGGIFSSKKSELIPDNKLFNILSKDEAKEIADNLDGIIGKTNDSYKTMDDYLTFLSGEGKGYIADYVKENENQVYITEDVIQASKNARAAQLAQNEIIRQSTLSYKLATVATKAFAIAANMIAFALISKGIQLAAEAIDNYVHRTERAEEALADAVSNLDNSTNKVTEVNDKLKDVEAKIREINSFGGLKVTRDGELEELQEQHDLLEQNLKLFKEQQYSDIKETAEKAEDDYTTTVTSEYATKKTSVGKGMVADKPIDVTPVEELNLAMEEYIRLSKEYAASGDSDTQEAMESARDRAQKMATIIQNVVNADNKVLDTGNTLLQSEQEIYDEASKNIKDYNTFLDEYVNYDETGIKTTQKELDILIDRYQKLKAVRDAAFSEIEGNVDLAHRPIRFNDDGSFSTLKTESFNYSDFNINKRGAFNVTPILPDGTTIDHLEDYINEKLSKGIQLEDLDIYMGDFSGLPEAVERAKELHNIHEKDYKQEAYLLQRISELEDAIAEKTENSKPVFNIEDENISKELDTLQGKFTTLASALEKVKTQKLTGSELIDLQQQFPELINTTDNLDTALTNLVNTSLSQVIKYLYTAGAPSGLIEAFQQLADEAKGISDWSDTFRVFDDADSKMKSLAEFNKALGDSFTITASEARKFSEIFPELLSMGQTTSSGLIQFNSDVVNDFVSGKQVELQAGKDAQIAQLENIKAELEAKKAAAQAALDLVAAKASGEIDAENQKNSRLSEAEKNLIQYLVDLGVEETNADAAAKAIMAGNIQEYDRIVAEVSGNVDSNLTDSINDAAGNVNTQSQSMIDSLYGVAKQAANASAVVASMGSGNPMAAVLFSINGAAESMKDFKPSEVVGDFKKQLAEELDINPHQEVDATVELELDISKYQKAIDDIDAQIALLEASGAKSLDDYINDLNKSSSGSKSGRGTSKFDWMQQKLDLIDKQVERLKNKTDILVGYKGKNQTTDTVIDLLIQKMDILQQMHDKYIESANAIGLSQEYVDKIQNGTIEIETIGDENLANQIKAFQDLYKKAEQCNSQIIEVTNSIYDLNISKLDNITNQFSQVLDIQSQIVNTEKQLLDLREKSGEEIFSDDYISLAGKQLRIVQENSRAYEALADEMSKINLKEGSDDWKKYNDQLQTYKNNMISAADAVEQYKDAMVDLTYKGLKDFKSAMDSINGTISTMNNLIGDSNLVDEFGSLTDRGLAQVALYAQQLANAKQEAAEYDKAIKSLDDALDSGLITQEEYTSRLQEYTSAQNSAVEASKEARDAMIALVKEGIQAEIDAKKKLVDETKAALDAEESLYEYQKTINEKQDNISRLQRAIASITSTDRDSLRQKLELQNELDKALNDLNETQRDHELEQRKEALDKEYEEYEESKQKESDELDSNLEAQNAAIEKYLDQVKSNYSTVYGILTQYGDEYSLTAIEDLTDPWISGSDAADLCANAVGDAIANIQYEINGLDFSPLYELVSLLEQIGMAEYGGVSSSAGYDDATSQGSWKQAADGNRWWYGNSNDDYLSDGVYTINGKQYGFDDEGYMVTGWRDDFGDWRYFEPANGQMVKSQWRKSKDGDWYYLDKNGVMATDMAVKDKDSDDYYYLDNDGLWDGQTLDKEQVRRLGYRVGYKKGTFNATKGWHLTDEDGIGSEAVLTNKGVLRQFEGGEIVFNPEAMKNLYDLAQDPTRFISGLNGIHSDVSDFNPARTVSINSPLVQIDGTGLSASEVAAIIKDETRDIDKRVAKSIRYELMGK